MKVTKKQLEKFIQAEARRQAKKFKPLTEGLAIDSDRYYEMKDRCEKDMNKIYELSRRLEDVMYEDYPTDDPSDLIDRIQEICEGWGR